MHAEAVADQRDVIAKTTFDTSVNILNLDVIFKFQKSPTLAVIQILGWITDPRPAEMRSDQIS